MYPSSLLRRQILRCSNDSLAISPSERSVARVGSDRKNMRRCAGSSFTNHRMYLYSRATSRNRAPSQNGNTNSLKCSIVSIFLVGACGRRRCVCRIFPGRIFSVLQRSSLRVFRLRRACSGCGRRHIGHCGIRDRTACSGSGPSVRSERPLRSLLRRLSHRGLLSGQLLLQRLDQLPDIDASGTYQTALAA